MEMSETLTEDEKAEIERMTDITAKDVESRTESATIGSQAGCWFTIRCDEEDVEDISSAIINDADVVLYKVEREEGFVSAKHKEMV